jgi:hypothetical protein
MATKNLSITSFLSLILRYWINEPRQVEFIQMSIIFFCEYSSYYKTFDKKKNLINQQTNRITLPRHPNPNAIGRSKGYLYKRTDWVIPKIVLNLQSAEKNSHVCQTTAPQAMQSPYYIASSWTSVQNKILQSFYLWTFSTSFFVCLENV